MRRSKSNSERAREPRPPAPRPRRDARLPSAQVATPGQIADVIVAAAAGRPVFLATDGRLRGRGRLVDDVKARVAGRTPIAELSDAPTSSAGLSASALMELEQGLCAGAAVHLGSSMSSWDWEVFYARALLRNDLAAFELAFHLENRNHERRGPTAGGLKSTILALPSDAPFALVDVHLRAMANRTLGR